MLNITHYSVQFSHAAVSDSLRPHESPHARPPCPSPAPGVYPKPCRSSWWCHPAISSSVTPFSSCSQSLPSSGSFPMNQLFTSGGQSTGVSVSKSVLPMNTQDWFALGETGWISLLSKGLSRVFGMGNTCISKADSCQYMIKTTTKKKRESSSTPQFKSIYSSATQLSLRSNSHIHTWLLEKPQLWLDRPLSAR